MKFSPLRSLCVWLAVLALIVPGYAQAPTTTPFSLEGIFNNKGELGLESVRNVALSQSTATPFYKSNGLETRFYEGDFKAAANTSQLAILSDDGTSVWIDGQKVLDGADKGQGFENFELTFHVLAKSFIKDRLYHLRLQYTNTIHRDDADVDGVSLWAYNGGGSIVPLKPLPPDIAIRASSEDESAGETANSFIGLGQHDASGASQTKTGLTVPGSALAYIVKLSNGTGTTQSLKLSAPANANGWTTRLYDGLMADETKNITTAALQDGWTLTLANGAEREVRVEMMPGATATSTRLVPITLALASDADSKDVARIEATMQKIAKIQWSYDGKNWEDVTATTRLLVSADETVGLKAIKAVADAEWPDQQPLGPKWKWKNDTFSGETVWLAGDNVTGTVDKFAIATLGTQSVSVTIQVVPACEVSISASKTSLLAGSGPSNLTSTGVSVRVRSDDDAPQNAIKVRLRALNAAGQPFGTWNDTTTSHLDVTTDADGTAYATWKSGNEAGEGRFEATVLGENDRPRDIQDVLDILTHKPYTQIKWGAWRQENGAWNRTVTASTWFVGQKLGGVAIGLSAQVKDYETKQIVAGWTQAAPFDAATGTTDVSGNFSTVQRWNPVEVGAWPHDYLVEAKAELQ